MTNTETYNRVFTECFSVDESALSGDFVYQCVPEWDSVGHMAMIAALEEAFGISMETDDVIDFSSYSAGKDILSKYNITF